MIHSGVATPCEIRAFKNSRVQAEDRKYLLDLLKKNESLERKIDEMREENNERDAQMRDFVKSRIRDLEAELRKDYQDRIKTLDKKIRKLSKKSQEKKDN